MSDSDAGVATESVPEAKKKKKEVKKSEEKHEKKNRDKSSKKSKKDKKEKRDKDREQEPILRNSASAEKLFGPIFLH
jgi:hypothetical protein